MKIREIDVIKNQMIFVSSVAQKALEKYEHFCCKLVCIDDF